MAPPMPLIEPANIQFGEFKSLPTNGLVNASTLKHMKTAVPLYFVLVPWGSSIDYFPWQAILFFPQSQPLSCLTAFSQPILREP